MRKYLLSALLVVVGLGVGFGGRALQDRANAATNAALASRKAVALIGVYLCADLKGAYVVTADGQVHDVTGVPERALIATAQKMPEGTAEKITVGDDCAHPKLKI